MRIFWTIVALLALLAAFIVPMGGGDEPMGAPMASTPSAPAGDMGFSGRPQRPSDQSDSMNQAARDAAEDDSAVAASETLENHSGSAETPVVEANQNSLSADGSLDDAAEDPTDLASADDTSTDIDDSQGDGATEFLEPETLADAESSDADDPDSMDSEPALSTDDDPAANAPPELAVTPRIDTTPVMSTDPVAIEEQDDGTRLVEGKYRISGTGTEEDPYLINWDYLISASQDYIPREGLNVIPARIAMLHDSWVKIVGYYIFPMFVAEVNEALVMQNQWDGCCIGVPPSVYDSIEVRFTRPRSMKRGHFALYGTFTGKLMVDPYIANRWLIGLYLLEEADLKVDL